MRCMRTDRALYETEEVEHARDRESTSISVIPPSPPSLTLS